MKLINIKNAQEEVTLKEAVFNPIGSNNGLYLPREIELLDKLFINTLKNYTLQEIAELVIGHLLHKDVDEKALRKIVNEAFNFPCPLIELTPDISVLELFHGPTLAFKDFGARFMSRLMAYLSDHDKNINIVVATSGDTGGAVANGFLGVPNIKVHILYPKNKVSKLQEKQLTTNGQNIFALEVDGTFDDCQAMVKQCFRDQDLKSLHLTTANSINIARLIPQSIYYFEAYKQIQKKEINISVPSGNFGNITAGLLAKTLGLPIHKFIAAHNSNDPVVSYTQTGIYTAKKAVSTLSNAMDIGDPSNFPRAQVLTGSTWNSFKDHVTAYSFDDAQTVQCIKDIYKKYKYVMDPHTAVGYLAAERYKRETGDQTPICIMSTAHPCKFEDETFPFTNIKVEIPERVKHIMQKTDKKISISNDYNQLKSYLLHK